MTYKLQKTKMLEIKCIFSTNFLKPMNLESVLFMAMN